MSSTMYENPLSSFPPLPTIGSLGSDLTHVDSMEDTLTHHNHHNTNNVDRREDVMIIDVDEFMDQQQQQQTMSFDTTSDSTVRLATVNSLPYCQLDDLSNARNLNETSSDLSLVNIHSSLSFGKTSPPSSKPKGKSLLANIFSLRKSPTKKVHNKRDSPSPPKVKLDGFVIHCEKKTWKERQLLRPRQLSHELVPTSSNRPRNLLEGNEKALKKHAVGPLLSLAKSHEWKVLFDALDANSSLLKMPLNDHNGQTLLHVLAQQRPPPDAVLRAIYKCPEAVKVLDKDKCLPLHYAAAMGNNSYLLQELLKRWPKGASCSNLEGDMPLHIASWGGIATEENVTLLLKSFPSASEVRNRFGELPLHLACSNQNASEQTVRTLFQLIKKSRNVLLLDLGGNSPLHIALKANVSASVIKVFRDMSEHGMDLFLQRNANNLLPLHIVLTTDHVDPAVVTMVIKAAPHTMKVPFPNGMMPIQIAIDRQIHDSIVTQLVLADMPICLKKGHGLLEVLPQKNHHSWWYLVTSQSHTYGHLIDGILSEIKLFPHILALAQIAGPTRNSAYESAPLHIKNIFQKNLIVADKYMINPSKKAIIQNGSYIFRVHDREQDMKMSNPLQWLQNGTASIIPSLDDEGVEVQYKDWHNSNDFTLHCYVPGTLPDIQHKKEHHIREYYKLSSNYIEPIASSGTIDGNYAGFVGCDSVNYVIYERCNHTLADVFCKTKYRRRKNSDWIRKSSMVLKHIAYDLMHLHDRGLIHGYIDPSTVAKYKNIWKLKDISSATPIGCRMSGPVRLGIPPESVVVKGNTEDSYDEFALTKSVTFQEDSDDKPDDSGDGMMECAGSDQSLPDVSLLEFSPEDCLADPSWDIWSFGLLMGQLCLHQSRVLLPNFEEAQDAHLKNLNKFDTTNLMKIKSAMSKSAGEVATDLIGTLLHPDPKKRPQSMQQILKHDFFHQHEIYFV